MSLGRLLLVTGIGAGLAAPGASAQQFVTVESPQAWSRPAREATVLTRATRGVAIEVLTGGCSSYERAEVRRTRHAVVITAIQRSVTGQGPYGPVVPCPAPIATLVTVDLGGPLGARAIKDGFQMPPATRYARPRRPPTTTRKRVGDPDDSDGRLDVIAASMRPRGRLLVGTLTTYEPWPNVLLSGVSTFVAFEFGVRRSRIATRCVDISASPEGQLRGALRDNCTALPSDDAAAPVRRPNPRAVRTVVRRADLGRRIRVWRVVTSFQTFSGQLCPAPTVPPPEQRLGECVDRTPWKRLVRR